MKRRKKYRKSRNHCGRPHRKYARRKNPRGRGQLSVPEKHQLKIALKTLTYSDVGARIMGGPTKEEAREIIFRLTGRRARKDNPKRRGPTEVSARELYLTERRTKSPREAADYVLSILAPMLDVADQDSIRRAQDTVIKKFESKSSNPRKSGSRGREIHSLARPGTPGRTVKENPKRRAKKTKAKTYYVVTDNEGAWLTETPSKKDTIVFGPTTNLFEAERALSREVGSGD